MRLWISLLTVLSCVAQTRFDVASVKPAVVPPGARIRTFMKGGPDTADPGRITWTGITLTTVLQRAFDLKPFQLTDPDWLSVERYDISATLPSAASKEQFKQMLQNLLAERFRLAFHRETKELQGYELVVGRNGSRLAPSKDEGPDVPITESPKTDAKGFPVLTAPGLAMMEGVQGTAVVSFLTARAQPVSSLAETLAKEFRLPVVDKTGLTGRFDFTLEFAPQAPGAVTIEAPEDAAPNLISAVPQQLGLRLESRKIPVSILIVDSVDQVPASN
jgi:uncharacterized protein (TIGR03435 family)